MKYCLYCNREIPKTNKFCNSSCAAKYNNRRRKHSSVTKSKISMSLRLKHTNNITQPISKVCKWCGNIFTPIVLQSGRISRANTCSDQCRHELLSYNSKQTHQKLIANNRFQGWKSRNITSYAEKFWIEVLSNNGIEYIKEKKIGKYFIDFYIVKGNTVIDLEIDGKQHKYNDRHMSDIERDKYLSSLGIIIYRVEWNSINNEEGKSKMKQKIDLFLEFYNKL